MSYFREIGILIILVFCIIQVLCESSASSSPTTTTTTTTTVNDNNKAEITITLTNIGIDAKPSIVVLDPSKDDKKQETTHETIQETTQEQDKTDFLESDDDEYLDELSDTLVDEFDYLGAENDPFDENMSFEDEESVSSIIQADFSEAAVVTEKSAVVSDEPASQTKEAVMPQPTNCRTQGQVAITYSEGPSDVTAKIARQLKKADARANFFVNATWLYTQQYAMVLQNLYNAGHFIGMTYRVPGDNPEALTDDDLRKDIVDSARTIEAVINVAPKYVRLHYTENRDMRTENMLAELGFVLIGYNLDSLDYMKKDTTGPNSIQSIYSETFKKYKDTYDAKGSFISIQYDLPYTGSLNAVPHIINTIDEEGYTMVRMDGCLNDPTPYKKSANETEYVNDKFSFNQPQYHQGQNRVVIDEAAINKENEEEEDYESEFRMQNVQNTSSTHTASLSAVLLAIAAIFTLFL